MSSVSNVIRFGKDGQAGAFDDMWLPVYGGEVLTAFDQHRLFRPLVRSFTLSSGNSMRFPNTHRLGSEYHQVGTEMLGLPYETLETEITLDDRPLVSHFELDDVDQLMAHFEVRNELANQAGLEISHEDDFKIAALILKAAGTADRDGSFPGGGIDGAGGGAANAGLDAGAVTDAAAFAYLDEIDDWVGHMADIDAPMENRYSACRANLWRQIKRLGFPKSTANLDNGHSPIFHNMDFNPDGFKIGDQAVHGQALNYEGVMLFWSNNFPVTDTSAGTAHPAKYQGDYSLVRGMCWQQGAVGYLTMPGLGNERFRDVRRGTDFMVTKMLTGGDFLRPELAYSITSAA